LELSDGQYEIWKILKKAENVPHQILSPRFPRWIYPSCQVPQRPPVRYLPCALPRPFHASVYNAVDRCHVTSKPVWLNVHYSSIDETIFKPYMRREARFLQHSSSVKDGGCEKRSRLRNALLFLRCRQTLRRLPAQPPQKGYPTYL
jgi:hypothetical protein